MLQLYLTIMPTLRDPKCMGIMFQPIVHLVTKVKLKPGLNNFLPTVSLTKP